MSAGVGEFYCFPDPGIWMRSSVLGELPGVGKGFRASSDLDSLCSVIHYVPGVCWGETFYGGFEKQGAACYAIGSSD